MPYLAMRRRCDAVIITAACCHQITSHARNLVFAYPAKNPKDCPNFMGWKHEAVIIWEWPHPNRQPRTRPRQCSTSRSCPPQSRGPRARPAVPDSGVESRPIAAGNFTKNPVMKHLNAHILDELPGADQIDVDGFFVGNHHYPIPGELEILANALGDLRV